MRKGIHLFALVIPIGYYLLPFWVAIGGVSIGAMVAILIDISRFRNWVLWRVLSKILLPVIREHEMTKGFTGASYILTTSAITILIFPKTIAIAAIVFIIIGDTAAALIGRLYGKHKLVNNKTVEGSAACLISLVIVSFLIPGLPGIAGIIGAITATLAEAFSGKIDDNLAVPLLSGLVMSLFLIMSGDVQIRFFDAVAWW